MSVHAFVLARNEAANIERCVGALRDAGVETTVLDSHSTDDTAKRAEALGAQVVPYDYVDHVTAYRHICLERIPKGQLGLVLDADMVVSDALVAEVRAHSTQGPAVLVAPVAMWWRARPLPHGSLYPPKPFAFRGGDEYFVAAGHGEQLLPNVTTARVRATLIHDDRKPYFVYLESQVRYARRFVERARKNRLTWRDRLRLLTPFMIFVTPFVSYVLKGGFLDGRAGILYALDRMIAEAIMFGESFSTWPLPELYDE